MIKVKVDDKIREYFEDPSVKLRIWSGVEISGEVYLDEDGDWICEERILFGPGLGVRDYDRAFTEFLKANYPEAFI